MTFKINKRGERPFTSREYICQDCVLTLTLVLDSGDTAREGTSPVPACPSCSKPLEVRGIQVGGVAVASFPDGHKRETAGFQQAKEAAKLEVIRGSASPANRPALDKEINKLRSVKK